MNQGTNIYVYDLEGKILYHSSNSLNQIKGVLGIHQSTCRNCIKNGNNYLNFFKITDTPIDKAKKTELSLSYLENLISEKRKLFLSNSLRGRKKVSLPLIITEVNTGKSMEFSSIISVVKHLKSINILTDRNRISKYLYTGKSYKGYFYYKLKKS